MIEDPEGDKAMRAHPRPNYWLSLLILLALALAACGGSGSGSGGSSNQGQTLHVLVGYNTNYTAQQRQWMQQINGEFKKLTGSTIAWDTYSSSNEEQTKLQTAVV